MSHRRFAAINWQEEYDGSLWATESAGTGGRIQLHISPPDRDGGIDYRWWSVIALDPDIEIADGVAHGLAEAFDTCEAILVEIRDSFDF